jgi:hypothetical protein
VGSLPSEFFGASCLIVASSFRGRLITTIQPKTFERFLEHCDAYIDCVVQEARLRDRGEVLELEDYVQLRRENSAVRVCFGVISYILGIDLPDEVFADPIFQKIYFSAVDMVCWANVRICCALTDRKKLTLMALFLFLELRTCTPTTWKSTADWRATTSSLC